MLSKKSSFNRTLFRKNLTRFWPLWGTAALLACLVPLYMLLGLLANDYIRITPADFSSALYASVSEVVPVVSFLYSILVAMAVWGYLFTPRSVGLLHSLPVDRTGLFITGTLSGMAMLIIPYAVMGVFLCLIALGWGFMNFYAVLITVVAVLFINLIFFGIATLCAMCTGSLLALPVLCIVVEFFAPMMEYLVRWLASGTLFGITEMNGEGMLDFLSPLGFLMESLNVAMTAENVYYLQGFGFAAVYGLIGAAMLALSWLLYKRRQSERAGDVVAFRWMRPLFRAVLAVSAGLGLGPLLYILVWESFFQRGRYTDLLPMAVCIILTGLVGYYAASMLLEKSLRVFRGSWKGAASVCLGTVILCGCLALDPLGLETWMPDLEDVQTASVYGQVEAYASAERNPELREKIIALHQAIIAEKDFIRNDGQGDEPLWLRIGYTTDNNREIARGYQLPLRKENWENRTSYEGILRELSESSDLLRQQLTAPQGYTLTDIYASSWYGGEHYAAVGDRPAGTDEERPGAEDLYAAILQDLDEGNIPGWAPGFVENRSEELPVSFHLFFHAPAYMTGGRPASSDIQTVTLYDSMVHTLEAMEEMGWNDLLVEPSDW